MVDSGQNLCYYVYIIQKRYETMLMLTGEYNHQLDAKNRIRIPAKLKKELGDDYYFTRGTNGCIAVMPKSMVDKKLEVLMSTVKDGDLEKQKGLRMYAKSFVAGEEDNQGRVVLNSKLKAYANIKKDVVICGAITRIEIWAKEEYDKYFADDVNFDEMFAKLDI